MAFKLKNFSLRQFSNDVNSSTDPDTRYIEWAQYRKQAAEFIEPLLKANKNGSMIVFGAGTLNDVELPFYCDIFGSIVLTDVDKKSMLDGIGRHKLSDGQKSKIKTLQMDYSGASDAGLFRQLERLAAEHTPAEKIADYIEAALQELSPETKQLEQQGAFDFVLSCPVYTQIMYTQIEAFLRILYDYGMYEYEELNAILNSAYGSMPALLYRYNDMLLTCADSRGLIVMMTDIVEMKKNDKKLTEIKKIIYSGNSARLDELIESGGLELAVEGRNDLSGKFNVIDSRYVIWPFNEDKEYLCLFMAGKKKLS